MSIQLPRNRKELHFTGSVKALAPERPATALGRERPKAPPPPPPSATRRPDRAPPERGVELETMRGPLVSIDEEDIHTQALNRDELDAALFPIARREKPSQSPNLPVPHFRSAAAARQAQQARRPALRRPSQGGSLPLGIWLIAAMVAGIVSYNLAPQAVESVAQAVRGQQHQP